MLKDVCLNELKIGDWCIAPLNRKYTAAGWDYHIGKICELPPGSKSKADYVFVHTLLTRDKTPYQVHKMYLMKGDNSVVIKFPEVGIPSKVKQLFSELIDGQSLFTSATLKVKLVEGLFVVR
jgi:hypothetical protein